MADSQDKTNAKTFDNPTDEEGRLRKWIFNCREEADQAKWSRMEQNKQNWDLYHLRHDFSYKEAGQSRQVLSRQAMAVEQTASFFQQSLADLADWFQVERSSIHSEESLPIKESEIIRILQRQLSHADFYTHVGIGTKTGLLASLIITKVTGKKSPTGKFRTEKKKKSDNFNKKLFQDKDLAWQLDIQLVRQENYYPDPTGEDLYEIEEMWMDFHKVKALSQGPDAIYDPEAVEQLSRNLQETSYDQTEKERETDQDPTYSGHRSRVKLTEYWGTVVDDNGEVLHENIVMTLANDKHLIRKPTPNPLWHQESPYIVAPLLEVPHSVWHKALMDAPTQHNITLNEIYNLLVDGAMKAVHSPGQIRVDWLEDPSQIEHGIPPGINLKVNSQAPPGAKVMEPVTDSNVPEDGINLYTIISQEFNSSALTNDLRQGSIPRGEVKATEVVEASQSITSVFQGVAKNVEQKWIRPILEKAWKTIAQRFDDLNKDELMAMFGKERVNEIMKISPQDRFAKTVNGSQFSVFGVSMVLNRTQDFRKWTTLLQTISGSPVLLEEFNKDYDLGKLVEEIITSLDIDKHRIELSEEEKAQGPAGGAPVPGGGDEAQIPDASQGPQTSLAEILSAAQGSPQNLPGTGGGNQ